MDGLLTVEENLLFAARLAGLGGRLARAAVADAIERTGLAERARAAGAASSPAAGAGWLDIARATLHQPDLLILDEPTVGLDPEHRDAVWALLDAPAPDARDHRALLHPLSGRGRAGRPGGAAGPRAGRGGRRARARSAPSWARRSRRSRAPAPSAWRARCAGSAPPGSVLRTGRGYPRRASRASASRWSSWRRRRRASSASPCGRRRWRTCTSRAPRSRGRTAASRRERLERGLRHRRPRSGAYARGRPADCSAAWRGRSCGSLLVGTGYNAIARLESGLPYQAFVFPGHRRDGGAVRRHAHGRLDRLRPRVRHAAADAGEPRRDPCGPGGPGRSRRRWSGVLQGGIVLAFAPLVLPARPGALAGRPGRAGRGGRDERDAGAARWRRGSARWRTSPASSTWCSFRCCS